MNISTDFSHFSDGARRFQAAMRGVPDRVPVCAQLHEFAMKETGVSATDFYRSPELLVRGTLASMEAYGIDVPVLDYDVYNIEAEALGQKIVYGHRHMPDVDRTRPLIRDRDDLSRIKTPDFDNAGRFAQVIEMNRLFRRLIGGAEIAVRFCAPFSLAANIRGLEQLLLDMYADPPFVRSLFDRLVEEVLAPWIERLKLEFPETTGISGDDASGSLPIVSPEIIRQWLIPSIARLRELCGPKVYVPNWVGEHYLRSPEEMLDLKAEVCPDFVEGQDPDVEKLGPLFYKRYAEKRNRPLVIGLGAAFLALSSPDEVVGRVKEYVQIGGRNGRFALYLCNLGATTPPENIKAAVETVRRHGVYR
jgi:uroporphyrinogen-III decarboxylase